MLATYINLICRLLASRSCSLTVTPFKPHTLIPSLVTSHRHSKTFQVLDLTEEGLASILTCQHIRQHAVLSPSMEEKETPMLHVSPPLPTNPEWALYLRSDLRIALAMIQLQFWQAHDCKQILHDFRNDAPSTWQHWGDISRFENLTHGMLS